MSFTERVLGVDLGTQSTRVASMAAYQRMPAIVRNNFSLESTPSVVAFDEERRHVGEEGLSKVTSRPKWAANMLRQLFSGSTKGLIYKMDDGHLKTPRGDYNLTQLLAMLFNILLGYSRKMDAAEAHEMPAKVVVSLPLCTPHAADLVKAAFQTLGMKKDDVSVTTDGTAAAACYRGLRYESLEKTLDEAQPIAIVDVGHGYNTVSVIKAARDGVEVLAERSTPTGSSVIDQCLLAKLLVDVKESNKQDFTDMPKPLARLTKESQKAKEIMSTVPKYTLNAEALTDTFDLQYKAVQESVKEWGAELLTSLEANVKEALAASGVEKIAEVETIGGGWRSPCVQEHLKRAFNVESLSVHLDPVQTVAQGCALVGAQRDVPAEEEEKPEEVNGVHFFSLKSSVLEEPAETTSEEEIQRMKEIEKAIQEEEAIYNKRMEARNALESYVLQLPSVGHDAGLPESVLDQLNGKVHAMDDWMNSEAGENAGPEEYLKKLDEVKEDINTNFKSIGEHIEKVREEEEEKDRQLAEEAKIAKETKEPKTDPQRLKAAQERKDQGVVLFKAEDYVQAITRFVQALTHLKDIYDLDKEDNKKKRDELALSCHLNIATASIKLKKWQHAIKNCTSALDYAESAKAYFRRGQASRQLADFDVSRADLKKALELSGGDVAIKKELDLLDKHEAEQKKKDKKMYAKMFGQ
eukprot:TRINITY_DN557_c4_g1_i1.p1 TRINITY_DN557_c4_g1~~TRINITY_DN557_c4_g1_i1.p1  ORF type:complete len:710 (+),score=255.73 TRINITY_DN557_c4_g1_i1:51-2132(+)